MNRHFHGKAVAWCTPGDLVGRRPRARRLSDLHFVSMRIYERFGMRASRTCTNKKRKLLGNNRVANILAICSFSPAGQTKRTKTCVVETEQRDAWCVCCVFMTCYTTKRDNINVPVLYTCENNTRRFSSPPKKTFPRKIPLEKTELCPRISSTAQITVRVLYLYNTCAFFEGSLVMYRMIFLSRNTPFFSFFFF